MLLHRIFFKNKSNKLIKQEVTLFSYKLANEKYKFNVFGFIKSDLSMVLWVSEKTQYIKY